MPSHERFSFEPFDWIDGAWDVLGQPARTAPCPLRVLTWNIWFGGHMFEERRDALFVELARRQPDVVALQEVTPELLAPLLAEPWLRAGWQVKSRPTRRRIDRMFLRSERWQARPIELVDTAAFDLDGTFVSDHFGLEASFTVAPEIA